MTYEELTNQATKSITDFMDRAKSTDDKYVAELCFNAAWGQKILWRDLANLMKDQRSHLDEQLEMWHVINKQEEVFSKLVDVQSVPAMYKNENNQL
ncbi:hypothetical protein P4P03_003932 [Escherichia coli]|nr:hypothetical protein [Escherichia coli]EKP9811072.1 hypothetical protein [Escherichia coli]EKQ0164148.1 hypothetical protein [Escherichia coli]EKQ0293864.1 hypothetical protein [Escherichia coli]ELW6127051.1 hypothetical protein [Escherichia coli]